MKPVTVVGAGFSGLTLAYYLNQLGVSVRVVEKSARAGGLVSTSDEVHGLVETAANAILIDDLVRDLFNGLDLSFAALEPARRRRYIFWYTPRRWPLPFGTTLKLWKLKLRSSRPRPRETVHQWAERVINYRFCERVISPVLGGVYAGDTRRMSATLALGSASAGKRGGSVAPRKGMGELISALERKLRSSGVSIEYGQDWKLNSPLDHPTILCTSAWAAAEVLRSQEPALAEQLSQCESLPLVSVTAFFPHHKDEVRGFGCVFPEAQNFNSLGVLFNDCIFSGRSRERSETWILGGALNLQVADLTDEQITQQILNDRVRVTKRYETPLAVHITRRPKALPHYTVEWEEVLQQLQVPSPLYLHGNYLGGLGLGRLLRRSHSLARTIKENHGG